MFARTAQWWLTYPSHERLFSRHGFIKSSQCVSQQAEGRFKSFVVDRQQPEQLRHSHQHSLTFYPLLCSYFSVTPVLQSACEALARLFSQPVEAAELLKRIWNVKNAEVWRQATFSTFIKLYLNTNRDLQILENMFSLNNSKRQQLDKVLSDCNLTKVTSASFVYFKVQYTAVCETENHRKRRKL